MPGLKTEPKPTVKAGAATAAPAVTVDPGLQLKEAVIVWVKAENSAIWGLIKIVHEQLGTLTSKERDQRKKGIQATLNRHIEEQFGEGEADKRRAHVSKILTIGDKATKADFKRWEDEGTGFYRAYAEFSKTQANPAKPKAVATAKAGNGNSPSVKEGAEGGEPGQPGQSIQKAGGTEGIGDIPAPSGQAGAAAAAAGTGAVGSLQVPGQGPGDFTEAWAGRINQDRKLWTSLTKHLTNPKKTILDPSMVVELFNFLSKKEALFKNTVGTILQHEITHREVVKFINDNPQQFADIKL